MIRRTLGAILIDRASREPVVTVTGPRKWGNPERGFAHDFDPLRSFALQLEEEVAAYERMQRGSFEPIRNLAGLGRLLIAARVFRNISQRELARRLGVHESQVSRDERNEYRSITVERANKILVALGVVLTSELSLNADAVALASDQGT